MVVGLAGQLNSLDDFVGTGLWVRARLHNSNGSYSYSFIQILSCNEISSEGDARFGGYTYKTYTFLEIDIRRLSKNDVYHCTEDSRSYILNGKGRTLPGFDIKLLTPIEVVPDDDIFSIVED